MRIRRRCLYPPGADRAHAKGLRNRIAGISVSRLSPNVRFWAQRGHPWGKWVRPIFEISLQICEGDLRSHTGREFWPEGSDEQAACGSYSPGFWLDTPQD
jgi:hypothetical protein